MLVTDKGKSTALVALAVVAAGCGGWMYQREETRARRIEHAPAPVERRLAITTSVLEDGALQVRTGVVATCTRRVVDVEETISVSRYKVDGQLAGYGIAFGAAGVGGGIGVMVVGAPAIGGPIAGVGLLIGLPALIASIRDGNTRNAVTGSRNVSSHDEPIDCPAQLKRPPRRIEVATPWGDRVGADVDSTGVARVALDWRRAGVDPLGAEARSTLRAREWVVHPDEPWRARGGSGAHETRWTPSDGDVDRMLAAIGRATGTETVAERVDQPPRLVVKEFRVDGEKLRAGEASRLVLTIENQGLGAAYRLVAMTKSEHPALHNLEFSFGRLAPGETRTRDVRAELPREERASELRVVLVFREANDNHPDGESRVFAVVPAARPTLGVDCKLENRIASGNDPWRGRANAGQRFRIACAVTNTGTAPALQARLTTSVGGAEPKTTAGRDIPAGGAASLETYVEIPREAEAGAAIPIGVAITETNFGARVDATFTIDVDLPWICEPPISREEFREKKSKFERLLAQGKMNQAQFDRYLTQLLGCLP